MPVKKYLRILYIFICCSTGFKAYCNDSLIHSILLRLNQLQVNQGPHFATGVYPSYREYGLNRGKVKDDDNIFYAGLIGFALRRERAHLAADDKVICDSILTRLAVIAPKFANKKGRNTYSFWVTDPPTVFPNSWLSKLATHNALPDDMDDTAIMMLALDEPLSTVKQVHALMQQYTNRKNKRAKTALPGYRQIDAYSTWFGKKMVVELDACVLSNILCMVQVYNLQWTKADSASLQFLVKMCREKDYSRKPGRMAMNYQSTATILYNLARLMSIKEIKELDKFTPELIKASRDIYNNTRSITEKIMMRTAMLRWGYNLPGEAIAINNTAELLNSVEQDEYIFFVANLASITPPWIAFPLYKTGISRFNYYCPAHNIVMLLEYLAEQKKFDMGLHNQGV